MLINAYGVNWIGLYIGNGLFVIGLPILLFFQWKQIKIKNKNK